MAMPIFAKVKRNKSMKIGKQEQLFAICASGEGTARRMKELIEEAVLPQ